MAERKTVLGWLSFINMACIKSVIDTQHYVGQGTVDTWFHGWQPVAAHPIAACINVLFDAGSVAGMLLSVGEGIAEWMSARQAGS